MNKFIKKSVAVGLASVMALGASSMTAFAASSTVNSTGSATGDVVNITETPIYSAASQNDDATDYAAAPNGVTGYDSNDWCDTDATGHVADGKRATEYRDIQRRDKNDNIDGDYNVDVFASQEDGAVEIIVPKTIILNGAHGADNSGNYVVKAKGNIAGDEIVTIKPVRNTTKARGSATLTNSVQSPQFYMAQEGKDDIVATVVQKDLADVANASAVDAFFFATNGAVANGGFASEAASQDPEITISEGTATYTDADGATGKIFDILTDQTYSESNDPKDGAQISTVAYGKVSVANLTAGMWHGNFNFHIAITDMGVGTNNPVDIH